MTADCAAAAAVVQWYEDECQRAFSLHKARVVREQALTRRLYPSMPLPPFLKRGRTSPLPEVRLEAQPENLSGVPGGLAAEEERAATLHFLTGELLPELYQDLLAAMRIGRGRLLLPPETSPQEDWGRRKRKAEHLLATLMIKRRKLHHHSLQTGQQQQPAALPCSLSEPAVENMIKLSLAAALSKQARKAAQAVEPEDDDE